MEEIKIRPVRYEVEHAGHRVTFELAKNVMKSAHAEKLLVTIYTDRGETDFTFMKSAPGRIAIIGEMLIEIAKHAVNVAARETPDVQEK